MRKLSKTSGVTEYFPNFVQRTAPHSNRCGDRGTSGSAGENIPDDELARWSMARSCSGPCSRTKRPSG